MSLQHPTSLLLASSPVLYVELTKWLAGVDMKVHNTFRPLEPMLQPMPQRTCILASSNRPFQRSVTRYTSLFKAGLAVDRHTTACMHEYGVFNRVSYIVVHFSFDQHLFIPETHPPPPRRLACHALHKRRGRGVTACHLDSCVETLFNQRD